MSPALYSHARSRYHFAGFIERTLPLLPTPALSLLVIFHQILNAENPLFLTLQGR